MAGVGRDEKRHRVLFVHLLCSDHEKLLHVFRREGRGQLVQVPKTMGLVGCSDKYDTDQPITTL